LFPAKLEYHRPEKLSEAIRLLDESPGLTLLAGGQSLIPSLKSRRSTPRGLVDISRIRELYRIDTIGDKIRIGSLVTYATLEDDEIIASKQSVLREAASQIADPLVRNRGTIGGGLCWADPLYDMPAVMHVLNSSMIVVGKEGERQIDADSFFVNPFKTALRPDEILTEVEVPVKGKREGYAYHKFRKGSGSFSITGAASYISIGEDDAIHECRLAITAPPSKAYRSTEAEQWLFGKTMSPQVLDHAAKLAADKLEYTDPHRASWIYTHNVLVKLIAISLKTAYHKASEAEE
jgi:carbon-monoxide dehydrogenase medium subunit